ncbi:MFS transporter [Nocardioides sp.]|uniref:MFS transporter n=1 Tax=Nocardioides sp. TaxID=35761 RepID=UPI0027267B9F|nr:MFS transporter [Nocardioides sp.]MDO9458143.1 MFS transporter [Nocardioides sp.]
MLNTYRQILARPGTALFSATGLVARLPIAMVGLGIVLLVEAESGSYGLAGSVSGVSLLANAAFAVLQARWIDRFGQSRVLPVAIVVWGVALAALMWSVESGWPLAATYALAAVTGAALPGVGACVRSRWAHVLPGDADRQTAFALEAVADEAVFITGPILVTVLATAVHPVAGLTTALTVGVAGTLAFSAQRTTEPPPHPPLAHRSDRARMPWATVLPLTVASLALGTLFGAAEVTTVAFTEERGNKAIAGFLLALWAAGSLIAGGLTGAVRWRRPVLSRLRLGAAAMTLTMVPLALIDTLWLMGAVLFVAGFSIAPTLIATMSMAEQNVPPSRLTEGMALVHTGIVAGVAPGAALAGVVIDAAGASPAYLVSVGGGLLALAAALLVRPAVVDREAPNLSRA